MKALSRQGGVLVLCAFSSACGSKAHPPVQGSPQQQTDAAFAVGRNDEPIDSRSTSESTKLVNSDAAQPVLCAPDSESTECRALQEIDQLIAVGKIQAAEAEFLARFPGPKLSERRVSPESFESELDYYRALVLARLLTSLGSLSFGLGDNNNEAAYAILEKLRQASLPNEMRYRLELDLGRNALALGMADAALSVLRPLAETEPQSAEAQAAFGIALLSTGRVQESLRPLSRAKQLDPEEAERHLVLGTARMLLGDLDGATRNFRGALAAANRSARTLDQKNELLARAYGDLGAVLLVQGDLQGGKAYLERSLGLQPHKATYLSNLSYAELLLGHPEQAEQIARRAISADEKLVSAWLNLGLAQLELGQKTEARESFERAQQLDPDDPRPAQNLADLLELSD